ncbi:MAG: AbrB/MazE/SpoVT family DNA-binding domain-containing protein [Candidatus Humimicrobiaceae bacterium]
MVMKFKTKIDRFGRIVIPKKIRNDFGLSVNSEVELETTVNNNIIVHPKLLKPFVLDKGGVLVVCSEPTEPFENFLQKDRNDRIEKTLKDI